MNAISAIAAATSAPALEVLTLALQGEVFALEAHVVREILDVAPITEVPGAPAFLNGLINVRGKIVPLSDLRLKLGMAAEAATIDSRIIVVEIEIDGEPTIVGIRADKVYEMTQIEAASLADTPRIGMRWRPEFVRCVGKHRDDFLIVLDLPAVLAFGRPPAP